MALGFSPARSGVASKLPTLQAMEELDMKDLTTPNPTADDYIAVLEAKLAASQAQVQMLREALQRADESFHPLSIQTVINAALYTASDTSAIKEIEAMALESVAHDPRIKGLWAVSEILVKIAKERMEVE